MKVPVLSLADGADWEARLVAELERGPHPVAIVRRCVDVVDMLAVAASGQGRAVLIDAQVRRVDADAVDRLRAAGVAAVGVIDRGDTAAAERLRAVGIDRVVLNDSEPSVVATVVSEAIRNDQKRTESSRDGDPVDQLERAFAHPSTPVEVPPQAPVPVDPATSQARRGSVIAVWGPTGAPGRTTVAVGLADELARLGSDALLIDADVYGGTVAAVLGVLDESPGLAAACRRAAGQRLDLADLASLCWQLTSRLRVLSGIPLASRWPELRPTAIGAVLAAARGLADYTVVDCGFCLETDEELSFDTLAPRRNGTTLAVLDDADVVVVVGAADAIGVQRLVRGLSELQETGVRAPIWVVLNRVRAAAVAGDPQRELAGALQRFAGRQPAAFLPDDARALDGAVSTGRTLAEAAPGSTLRQGLAELALALAGLPTARAGRRRRRR